MTNIEISTKQLIDDLKATTAAFGLANDGSEYKIITEIFLYKYFNDKFGYEAKQVKGGGYGARLSSAAKWDEEYDSFTEDEVEDLWSYLPSGTPHLKPHQTLAHLANAQQQGDFSTRLDGVLVEVAALNASIFSIATSGRTKIAIFEKITTFIRDEEKRDEFALALMKNVASFNFEDIFSQKYDFFSTIFEHLIKDYNKDGGGKYAEYYTPKAVAAIMAQLLVEDSSNLRSITCYDPAAGTGTLLMALAHQIGEEKCSIFSQDLNNKSSEFMRLNLILNNLVKSLPNVVQGNTLTEPAHKEADGSLAKFDYIVSNPPFNLDFSGYSETLKTDGMRFWAGVPEIPNKKKDSMAIYLCFIQHVIYSLKPGGRAAIVVPTGFVTAKSGIAHNIIKKLVDQHWLLGVVSMPSNIFATTGTNVSVLFIHKEDTADRQIIMIDASKLGKEVKEGKNKKTQLQPDEITRIVTTFKSCTAEDGFSVSVSYDDIIAKSYMLSAGYYFDVHIDPVDITPEAFAAHMAETTSELESLFSKSHDLEKTLMDNLKKLKM